MGLIDPSSTVGTEALVKVRAELLGELSEFRADLEDAPDATLERSARGLTVRNLVDDLLGSVGTGPAPTGRPELIGQINLLYDVMIIAAEYYKMFVRTPSAARPAGRI